MKMSNKVYDVLKVIAEIIIPALATAWWVLSEYAGILPAGETVVGALIAIDTCLGSILAYCSYEYEEEEPCEDALPDPIRDDIGEKLGETDGEGEEE